MRQPSEAEPDWRDAPAYEPLLAADRSLFAWEWLRRDPRYAAAATVCGGNESELGAAAGAFGLVRLQSPGLSVPNARPLWSAAATPFVLMAQPGHSDVPADAFDLERLQGLATLVVAKHCEHLLLSDGLRCVRLDGRPGTFGSGHVVLRYHLHGLASARAPLLVLRRLLALAGSGRFAAALHPPEPRARRWILMLRAWDGIRRGADQRDLADVLLRGSAAEPRWRSRNPSLRSRAQRLARAARTAASGGYRSLLR